jgi:hypothetical protein
MSRPVITKTTKVTPPIYSNLTTGCRVRIPSKGIDCPLVAINGHAAVIHPTFGHRIAEHVEHPGVGKFYSVEQVRAVLGKFADEARVITGPAQSLGTGEIPAIPKGTEEVVESTKLKVGDYVRVDGGSLYHLVYTPEGNVCLSNVVMGYFKNPGVKSTSSIDVAQAHTLLGSGDPYKAVILDAPEVPAAIAEALGVRAPVAEEKPKSYELRVVLPTETDRSRPRIVINNLSWAIDDRVSPDCGTWGGDGGMRAAKLTKPVTVKPGNVISVYKSSVPGDFYFSVNDEAFYVSKNDYRVYFDASPNAKRLAAGDRKLLGSFTVPA